MKNFRRLILFSIAALQGSNLLAQNFYNDVIVNEFSVNPAAGKEWVELLVVKPGGVDMRNWQITDLGGPTAPPTATEGTLIFPNANYLTSVPEGAHVVVVLKTPAANSNTFIQDTIATDGTLVLFSVGLAGGVLDTTRTMDLSTTDNCVLVDGLLTGTIIDLIGWGGSIASWNPAGLWADTLHVSSNEGAYFTNSPDCGLINDAATIGWFEHQTSSSLTPGQANTNQVPPNTRRWAGTDPDWDNTLNWCPAGPPNGMNIIIPQATLSPVIVGPANILSLHVLPGGRIDVNAPVTMSIQGKLTVDSSGTIAINDAVNVTEISDDVVLRGALTVAPAVPAQITCQGDWIRGSGSSFSRGASIFYFTNLQRQLNVDRGTFHSLILGPARGLRFVGNVAVDNALVLRDTVSISRGDTLTINNTATTAISDSLGGRLTRGTVRRMLDTTSTARIRFHDNNVAVQFDPTGIPGAIVMTVEPDTVVGPLPTFYYVKRVYGIEAEGGSNFSASLSLRYDQSEVQPGIREDTLRLWRTTNNGQTWIFVGGTVDTAANVITAYPVTAFSKWQVGTPNTPPTGVLENNASTRLTMAYLHQNYPNPFNPSTEIRFEISTPSFVKLHIYDVLGRSVATLVDVQLQGGLYTVPWDGRNRFGRPVAAGVYFYKISVRPAQGIGSTVQQVRKMVLLK